MPVFHFHVEDGVSEPDEDGADLPDVASARREAARLAGQLLCDEPELVWRSEGEWRLVVTDEGGRTLFTLLLRTEEGATQGA
jgi:hypothetical protein